MGPSPDQKYRANIFEAYDVKQERLFNALEECLKPQGVSPPHIGTGFMTLSWLKKTLWSVALGALSYRADDVLMMSDLRETEKPLRKNCFRSHEIEDKCRNAYGVLKKNHHESIKK